MDLSTIERRLHRKEKVVPNLVLVIFKDGDEGMHDTNQIGDVVAFRLVNLPVGEYRFASMSEYEELTRWKLMLERWLIRYITYIRTRFRSHCQPIRDSPCTDNKGATKYSLTTTSTQTLLELLSQFPSISSHFLW